MEEQQQSLAHEIRAQLVKTYERRIEQLEEERKELTKLVKQLASELEQRRQMSGLPDGIRESER